MGAKDREEAIANGDFRIVYGERWAFVGYVVPGPLEIKIYDAIIIHRYETKGAGLTGLANRGPDSEGMAIRLSEKAKGVVIMPNKAVSVTFACDPDSWRAQFPLP